VDDLASMVVGKYGIFLAELFDDGVHPGIMNKIRFPVETVIVNAQPRHDLNLTVETDSSTGEKIPYYSGVLLFESPKKVESLFFKSRVCFGTLIRRDIQSKHVVECDVALAAPLENEQSDLFADIIHIVMNLDIVLFEAQQPREAITDESVSASTNVRA